MPHQPPSLCVFLTGAGRTITESNTAPGAPATFAKKFKAETGAVPDRGIQNHVIAFLLCLGLAFIFTLPGSLSLGSGLLGYPGDNFQHAWFLWHFAHALLHARNPFYTRLIFSATGANLAWSTTDPLAGVLALPLSVWAGPVIAYNVSLILQLALAAFCARLLCLRITRSESAAFIGGMIFGFSPYLMAHALAHLSLVTAFPIPLFVLALDRIFLSDNAHWGAGIPLGLALLLAAFAHYDYVILCLLFSLFFLAIELFASVPAGIGRFIQRIWRPLAAGAAVFAVGFSPLVWMMAGRRSEIPPARGLQHLNTFSAGVFGFLIPSWNHVFFGRLARRMNPKLFAAGIEGTVYIGLVALALAAIGFWKGRSSNRRWASRAAILGGAFYLLSLGPRIHVLGHELNVPGPDALFVHLPFAKFVSAPARFDALVALCIAILCSLGAKYLVDLPTRRYHCFWIVPLIALLVTADYLTIPFPRSSTIDPGQPYAAQAQIGARGCMLPPTMRSGTILTFPLVREPYCLKSMWMQVMTDGRFAIVDGYLSYTPPEIWRPFWSIRILRSLMSIEHLNPAPVDITADAASVPTAIRELNLRGIVIFDSPERDAGVRYIEDVFGVQPERSGSCTVFPLHPPERAGSEGISGAR